LGLRERKPRKRLKTSNKPEPKKAVPQGAAFFNAYRNHVLPVLKPIVGLGLNFLGVIRSFRAINPSESVLSRHSFWESPAIYNSRTNELDWRL